MVRPWYYQSNHRRCFQHLRSLLQRNTLLLSPAGPLVSGCISGVYAARDTPGDCGLVAGSGLYQYLDTVDDVSSRAEPHVWTASDLSRHRTTILAEAERDVALVRSTAGHLLTFTSAARVADLEQAPRIARMLGHAVSLLDKSPSASQLGELAFAASWDLPRRRRFVTDLRDVALHALALRDTNALDAFLAASAPRPAQGVLDPQRVSRILGSGTSRRRARRSPAP